MKKEINILENMVAEEKSGLELHPDYPAIIVVICLLVLFSIAGTIGNALVLYVYSIKREKSTTTIFILTLAGTDFFTCLIIIPYTIAVEYVSKKIQYDSACKIYQFLITSNVPFSAFIMVVIAFDRYLKICRPWNNCLNTKVSKRTIILLLVFATLLGVITALVHGVPNETNQEVGGGFRQLNSTSAKTNLSSIKTNGNISPEVDNNAIEEEKHDIIYINSSDTNANKSRENLYAGYCIPNEIFIGQQARSVFQKFYASLFLISVILVFILYSLIFRALAMRRSRKAKRKLLNGTSSHNTCVTTQTCGPTTKLTQAEDRDVESVQMQTNTEQTQKPKRSKSLRQKHRAANLKTAGILFIVTIVFIVAFLPAWLMAMRVLQGNIVLFYMHFSYNVANPIIYAFFNQNFREEMKNVFHCS